MKRYFVTGAQGFVGRYLVSQLLAEASVEVVGAGRSARSPDSFTHSVRFGARRVSAPLPDGLRASLETSRYLYLPLDLRHRSELAAALREFRPQVVIHLASALRDDPEASLVASNIEATIDLLEACAASGVAFTKLVLCSTGGVYGIPAGLPIHESMPCAPIDLYSASKLAAEHFSRILALRYRIPAVWARLFNLVGPGQDERHVCGRLASQTAAIARGFAPPTIEIGALDTTRDFIDVRDAASALLWIAEKGEPGRVYNAASGSETPVRAVLQMLMQLAGLAGRVRIEQEERRSVDIPRHFACIERLRALGFEARFGLARSLGDLLDYYRLNEPCSSPQANAIPHV